MCCFSTRGRSSNGAHEPSSKNVLQRLSLLASLSLAQVNVAGAPIVLLELVLKLLSQRLVVIRAK